uniref:Glycerophosphodiester phosphodiesterase domain containing 2 n=1 Tax=Amphilophus citrinellus TaxID=61819 RepID=A0A3Q0RW85_AMPCI
MSLLSLCWLYMCFVMSNDQQDFNEELFKFLNLWVNGFMVLVIISAVLVGYCILLLVRTQFCQSTAQWNHVLKHIQNNYCLTLSFYFLTPGSKVLIAVVFLVVSVVIFLCPLLIHSPCLIHWEELPEKPKLIGHRGAPMLGPENTMMSFNRCLECGVIAFETDVQLSKKRIPFLMHDHGEGFLLRTTNVKDKFPNENFSNSTNLTMAQLQTLNAGEWFLKERETARNQTIPSLLELLKFAQQHNTSVLFDLKGENQENDAQDTVETILNQGIDQRLILWLPTSGRDNAKIHAPRFIQVYGNESERAKHNGHYLNVKYSMLKMEKIRDLRKQNVTVNLWVVNERWLFSLLWCAGASSVTTNACHLLKEMDRPDWVLVSNAAPGHLLALAVHFIMKQ